MTQKIYTTAKGKSIDFGSLRLQNEHVRAVGNMGVNTRGDRIDANGNVIDSANNQLQRRIQRQSNVSDGQVHTSTRAQQEQNAMIPSAIPSTPVPVTVDPMAAVLNNQSANKATTANADQGLAAAIARSKTVKQELEKTNREKQQDQPVRKI